MTSPTSPRGDPDRLFAAALSMTGEEYAEFKARWQEARLRGDLRPVAESRSHSAPHSAARALGLGILAALFTCATCATLWVMLIR